MDTMNLRFEGQIGRFVGIILYAVSTVMSMKLLVQFAESGFDQLLFGAVGFGFQTGMAILFIVGFKMAKADKAGLSAIFFGSYLFLFFLSLTASMGFFISSSHEKSVHSVHSDEKYTMMQDQLSKLDESIGKTQNQMDEYAAKRYYTKGVEPLRPILLEMQKKRDQVYSSLMAYNPVTSGDSFFVAVSEFFGGNEDPKKIKFVIFFCVAVAVDAIGALLIALSLVNESEVEGVESGLKTALPFRNFHQDQESQDENQGMKPAFKNPDRRVDRDHKRHEDKRPFRSGLLNQDETENPLPNQQAQPDQDQTESNPLPGQNPLPVTGFTAYPTVGDQQGESVKDSAKDQQGNQRPSVKESVKDQQQGITNEILTDYVECLFSESKADGSLVGRLIIADEIGISNHQAEKIHNLLKGRGLVEVRGKKTFPAMSKAEVVKSLKGGGSIGFVG